MIHVQSFYSAHLYHQLLTEKLHVDSISKLLSLTPDSNENFLKFQLQMKDKDIKTADPLQRGGSTIYHQCFFHEHDSEEEQNECLAKAKK